MHLVNKVYFHFVIGPVPMLSQGLKQWTFTDVMKWQQNSIIMSIYNKALNMFLPALVCLSFNDFGLILPSFLTLEGYDNWAVFLKKVCRISSVGKACRKSPTRPPESSITFTVQQPSAVIGAKIRVQLWLHHSRYCNWAIVLFPTWKIICHIFKILSMKLTIVLRI